RAAAASATTSSPTAARAATRTRGASTAARPRRAGAAARASAGSSSASAPRTTARAARARREAGGRPATAAPAPGGVALQLRELAALALQPPPEHVAPRECLTTDLRELDRARLQLFDELGAPQRLAFLQRAALVARDARHRIEAERARRHALEKQQRL